jgi:hypothetical protein
MGNDKQLEDTTRMWFGKEAANSTDDDSSSAFYLFLKQVPLGKRAELEFVNV